MRRPAARRHPIVRPRLDRLEDRTVPSGTPYYPPTSFLANPDFTTAGAKATVPPVATAVGMPLSSAPAYVNDFAGPVAKPRMAFTLAASSLSSDPIPAALVYAPTADGKAAEAWELVVHTPDGQHWYDMAVDATTGAV